MEDAEEHRRRGSTAVGATRIGRPCLIERVFGVRLPRARSLRGPAAVRFSFLLWLTVAVRVARPPSFDSRFISRLDSRACFRRVVRFALPRARPFGRAPSDLGRAGPVPVAAVHVPVRRLHYARDRTVRVHFGPYTDHRRFTGGNTCPSNALRGVPSAASTTPVVGHSSLRLFASHLTRVVFYYFFITNFIELLYLVCSIIEFKL